MTVNDYESALTAIESLSSAEAAVRRVRAELIDYATRNGGEIQLPDGKVWAKDRNGKWRIR